MLVELFFFLWEGKKKKVKTSFTLQTAKILILKKMDPYIPKSHKPASDTACVQNVVFMCSSKIT